LPVAVFGFDDAHQSEVTPWVGMRARGGDVRTEPHLLVLGVGDVLLRDDGLGVEAVRRLLERREQGGRVRLVDGGTLGLGLIGFVTEARDVILVSALPAEAPLGAPVRLEGEAVLRALGEARSPHAAGLLELLAAARRLGRTPRRLVAVGLVPSGTGAGAACSPVIARALPSLVATVVREARALGYELPPRRPPEARRHHRRRQAA
jgi:hydrogenase maturation protease